METIQSPQPDERGLYPATITLLQNNTASLTWGIIERNDGKYHTYRWLSEHEKDMVESISLGNMYKIQAVLSNYI